MSEAGFGNWGSAGNGRSWLAQFETNAAVRVPEHRVAEDASLVRWKLWRRRPDGTREEVREHPVLEWWGSPQPGMLGIDWRYCWFVQMDMGGDTFLWLLDPEDPWIGTVILSPDWLESLPGTRGPNYNFVLPDGSDLELKPKECLHMKRPRPRNPMGRGLGFGPALAEDVQQLQWMAKFNSNFFRNGAHVGNVVGVDGLDDDGWDRLEASYKANQAGVENAHKTFFTSGKVTSHELGARHKDLDFNTGVQRATATARQVVGTPATIIGDNSGSNATAYESGNIHQTYGIWTRCERLKENVNHWLLPRFEDSDGLEFDFADPIKQKAELEAMQYNQALDRGVVRLNEYRHRLGQDPFKGGDRVMVPLNTVPLKPEDFDELQSILLSRKGTGGSNNSPTENPVDHAGPQSQGQVERALRTLLKALEDPNAGIDS